MIDIYKVGAFHQKIHFTYSGIRTGDPRWRTSSSTDTLRTNVVEYWKNRKRSRVPVLDDISLSSTGTRRTNGSSPAAVSAVIIIIIIYFSAVLS